MKPNPWLFATILVALTLVLCAECTTPTFASCFVCEMSIQGHFQRLSELVVSLGRSFPFLRFYPFTPCDWLKSLLKPIVSSACRNRERTIRKRFCVSDWACSPHLFEPQSTLLRSHTTYPWQLVVFAFSDYSHV